MLSAVYNKGSSSPIGRHLIAAAAVFLSLSARSEDTIAPLPAVTASGSVVTAEMRETIDRAVDRVYPSLIRIHVVAAEPGEGRMEKHEAAGSGVIISKDGHVITNHHVAGKATRLLCRLPDGEELEAELVGTDPLTDIAVIKLLLETRRAGAKDLPVAVFGNSDDVRVGDTVLAMGSPGAMSQSVTKGIVSNAAMMMPDMFWFMRFDLDGENTGTLVRWIGHDAAIYPGNSGGPLVNLRGEIIGINEVDVGLGGAIPANLAKSVAEQIIQSGEVARSWVGFNCQSRLKDSAYKSGVLVGGVVPGSPAASAGLIPGDVIVMFDGSPTDCAISEDMPLFNRLVLSTPIGKTVKVVAMRGNEQKTFALTTEAREKARADDEELKQWGMTTESLTRISALELKRPDKRGALVGSVRPGGPCGEAKPSLQEGDVIIEVEGKSVADVAALREITHDILGDREGHVPVLVAFERKGAHFLTVVKIGAESKEDLPATPHKAWLPVSTQVLTRDLAHALNLDGENGVRITRILTRAEAEPFPLSLGDILLRLDGDRISAVNPEDVEVLPAMIRQYKVGAEVEFDIVRDGKRKQVKVKLQAPPTSSSDIKRYKDAHFEMTLRELTFDDRTARQIEDDVTGVLVEGVVEAGWAALAHLGIGDILLAINGTATPDVETVERLLRENETRKAKRVVFFVKRGINTMYLEIEPDWE